MARDGGRVIAMWAETMRPAVEHLPPSTVTSRAAAGGAGAGGEEVTAAVMVVVDGEGVLTALCAP